MPKKTAKDNFEVVLEPEEEGGFHVFAPALKGCHSYGKTREEALDNISEAICCWLDSAKELGIKVPQRDNVKINTK